MKRSFGCCCRSRRMKMTRTGREMIARRRARLKEATPLAAPCTAHVDVHEYWHEIQGRERRLTRGTQPRRRDRPSLLREPVRRARRKWCANLAKTITIKKNRTGAPSGRFKTTSKTAPRVLARSKHPSIAPSDRRHQARSPPTRDFRVEKKAHFFHKKWPNKVAPHKVDRLSRTAY